MTARALRRRPWHAAWWGLLALALVLSQSLGQLHQGLHGLPQLGLHAAAAAAPPSPLDPAASAVAPAHRHTAGDWLGRLFAEHHVLECQVLDQLAHADAPGFVLPELAAAPPVPMGVPLWRASKHVAPAGAPYSARAPPVLG